MRRRNKRILIVATVALGVPVLAMVAFIVAFGMAISGTWPFAIHSQLPCNAVSWVAFTDSPQKGQ